MATHHLDFPTYFLLLLFITPSQVLIRDSPLLVEGSYSIFCFLAVLIIKQFLFIYKKCRFFHLPLFRGVAYLFVCLFVLHLLRDPILYIQITFPGLIREPNHKNTSCQEGQVPLRRHRKKICLAYDKQEDKLWRA